MKTNRFFTAILSVALCMNFVSCDDDEENKGGIDGNTEKRLTKVEISSADYQTDYEYCGSVEYEYDGNRLSRITVLDDDSEIYTTLEISETEIKAWHEGRTTIYTLNNNGYVINDNHGTKYNYYDEGYLKSIEKDGDLETFSYDKEWNMIASSYLAAPNILYPDKILNKGNLYISDGLGEKEDLDILGSVGFFGKTSKYLVQEYNYAGEEDEEPDYFEYKLDEDGYVKEVNVLLSTGESDIYKYTYENIK